MKFTNKKDIIIPCWRTETFISTFREVYRIVDLESEGKGRGVGNGTVLCDDEIEGHKVYDKAKKSTNDNVSLDNDDILLRIHQNIEERTTQKLPLSTIPSFLHSLMLLQDVDTRAEMRRIIDILFDLDELNNEFIAFESKRNSESDRSAQAQFDKESAIVNKIRNSLSELKKEEILVLPSGDSTRWSKMFFVVECERYGSQGGEMYSFTVCNPTLSCQYHAMRKHPITGVPQFCGLMTISNIPRERLLNSATLFLLVHLKTDGARDEFDNSIYESLLPYLAGELTDERVLDIENNCASKAEPADWITVSNRDNASAEWEGLQLVFRLLLRRVGVPFTSDHIKLSLFLGHLKTALAELKDLPLTFPLPLGDRTALRAACRLTARYCVDIYGGGDTTSNVVLNAREVIEELIEVLEDREAAPVEREALPNDPGETAGTAPVRACLFPRWQMLADTKPLPDTLTGGTTSQESADITKLEKVESTFVDLLLPAPEPSADGTVSVVFVLSTIQKLSSIVRKLVLRYKNGFMAARRLLVAVVEDVFVRLLPCPDMWCEDETGVRTFKQNAALNQLLSIGQVYMGARMLAEADDLLPLLESTKNEGSCELPFRNLLASATDAERILTMSALLVTTDGVLRLTVNPIDTPSPVAEVLIGKKYYLAAASWDGTCLEDLLTPLRMTDPYLMRCRHKVLSFLRSRSESSATGLLASVETSDPRADNMRCGFRNRSILSSSSVVGSINPTALFNVKLSPTPGDAREPALDFTFDVLQRINVNLDLNRPVQKALPFELPPDFSNALKIEKERESKEKDGGEETGGSKTKGSKDKKKEEYSPEHLQEIIGWWYCSSWERLKEFKYLRDIHTLCKVGMESRLTLLEWLGFFGDSVCLDNLSNANLDQFRDTITRMSNKIDSAFDLRFSVKLNKASKGKEKSSSNKEFSIRLERVEMDNAAGRVMFFSRSLFVRNFCDDGIKRVVGVVTEQRSESKLHEAYAAAEGSDEKELRLCDYVESNLVNEVTIMYSKPKSGELSLGSSGLPEADVETLLTFSCTPLISIPLLLEFLDNGKVDIIASLDARTFIESILYESGPYSATPLQIREVPCSESLGTRYGALFEEIWKDPATIMSACVRISYSAAQLCSSLSFRNTLIDVMLFVITLDISVLSCSIRVGEFEIALDTEKEDVCLSWQSHIVQFLNGVALPLLRHWLIQAEQSSAFGVVVNFAAYIALCEGTLLEVAESKNEDMNDEATRMSISSFIACSCFTVQWLSKAASQDHLRLPSMKLFLIMQRQRSLIMTWCNDQESNGQIGRRNIIQILEAAQQFTLREKSFSASFLGQHDSSLWHSTSNNLYLTQRIVESEHPYPFDMQSMEKIEISDAPYLILVFDANSSLGKRKNAHLTIYSDKERTEVLQVINPGEEWPGADGAKPLVVKGSCVYLYFFSPGPPPEGRVASIDEEWGYRLYVRAPVSNRAVKALRDELNKSDGRKHYSTKICREALRECVNDIPEAKALLKSQRNGNTKYWVSANNTKSGDTFPGCYERSLDAKSIHLQTYEVFESSSSLTDLPNELWEHAKIYMEGATGGTQPPSSVVCDNKKVRVHRAVCARKSEVITYTIRVWLKPEEVPSREHFFAEKSKNLLKDLVSGVTDAISSAGRKFCDYGLHGIENLETLNHPQLDQNGNVLHLGKLYLKVRLDECDMISAWHGVVCAHMELFDELSPPQVWKIQSPMADDHHPQLLCWKCGTDFENSAFFEVYMAPSGVAHVYEIRRYAGRSYRFQVFASDARDSFAVLPLTNDINITVEKGTESKTFSPGIAFDIEPDSERQYEQGLIFGNLTIVDTEAKFREETWYRGGSNHTEVWRTRQLSRRNLGLRDASSISEITAEFVKENDTESLIPSFMLGSLLPQVLVNGYHFWRTGKNVIRGYALPPSMTEVWNEMNGSSSGGELSIPLRFKHSSSSNSVEQPVLNRNEERTQTHWWRGSEIYIRLFSDDDGGVNAVVERIPQSLIDNDYPDYDSSPTMQELRKKEQAAAQLVRRGILLDASFAEQNSALHYVRKLLECVQPLSGILFWTTADVSEAELRMSSNCSHRLPISFVEMPLLGLSFDVVQVSHGRGMRLRCVERSGYYVKSLSDIEPLQQQQIRNLTEGIQEFLLLEDEEGNMEVLIPSRKFLFQSLKGCPFHCGMMPLYAMERSEASCYYIYEVHSSGAYFIMTSLASRLYMIKLRMAAHRYEDASRLIDGLFFKSDTLESSEWTLVQEIGSAKHTRTANAVLCLLKFFWRVSENKVAFNHFRKVIRQIYMKYLTVRSQIDQTLLPSEYVENKIQEVLKTSSESLELPMDRLGSVFRARASNSVNIIKSMHLKVSLKNDMCEIRRGRSIIWKPHIDWKEEDITPTGITISWSVKNDECDTSVKNIWNRVIYFVTVCSAPKNIDKNSSVGFDDCPKHEIGQWLFVKSVQQVGVVSRIVRDTAGDFVEYEIRFPGISISVNGTLADARVNCVYVKQEKDLIPWDVVVNIHLGLKTRMASVKDLQSNTEYGIQLFAMTMEGIGSNVDFRTFRTKMSVPDERGCEAEADKTKLNDGKTTSTDEIRSQNDEVNDACAVQKGEDVSRSNVENDEEKEKINPENEKVNDGVDWQNPPDSSENILMAGTFHADTHMSKFMRYKRCMQAGDTISSPLFMGTDVRGLRAHQWAKNCIAFERWEIYPHPSLANTLLETYEILSGAVTWSLEPSSVQQKELKGSQVTVGDRVEILPEELFVYNDRPDEYKSGVVLHIHDTGTCNIRQDDGRLLAQVPLSLVYMENCVDSTIPTWRCLNTSCGKLNDIRSSSCRICYSHFPLHTSDRMTEIEKAVVAHRRWPWGQHCQDFDNEKLIGIDIRDDSFAFAYYSLMLRLFRCFNSAESEYAALCPSQFQSEIEALLIVVHILTEAANGKLSFLSAQHCSDAEKYLSELPVFPYNSDTAFLHAQGYFTFEHGIGSSFFDKLVYTCYEVVHTDLWAQISNTIFTVSSKKLFLCENGRPGSNYDANLLPFFRNEKQQSMVVCHELSCRSPLAEFVQQAKVLKRLSKTCQLLCTRSNESIPQSHTRDTQLEFDEMDKLIQGFLEREAERGGKDCTAYQILSDMKGHPLCQESEFDGSLYTLGLNGLDYAQMCDVLSSSSNYDESQWNLSWLFSVHDTVVDLEAAMCKKFVEYRTVTREAVLSVNAIDKIAGNALGENKSFYRLLQFAGFKRRVNVEDLIRGLLSSEMLEDLKRLNPTEHIRLQHTALTIAFGTVLSLHASRCIHSLRLLMKELMILQEDWLKLALVSDTAIDVLERYSSAGLLKQALFEARENQSSTCLFQSAVAIARRYRDEAIQLDRVHSTGYDLTGGYSRISSLDILLQVYSFDVKFVSQRIIETNTSDVDIAGIACRGMCVDGIVVTVPSGISNLYDKDLYHQSLRKSLVSHFLLLQHLADGAANMVLAEHCVVTKYEDQSPSAKESVVINPQYLVFEVLTGFMLRDDQVKKIGELYDKCCSSHNQSAVHELIMGSGKTACIGPMLCLLLAKGERAVLQIVPDPLLEQTRSVLERVFSSVLIKQVFVMSFSRNTFDSGDSAPMLELKRKLLDAREAGHIILCSPSQVKKLLLKFIDFMTLLKDINPLVTLPPGMLPSHVRDKARDLVLFRVSPLVNKLTVMGSILDIFRAPDQSQPKGSGGVALIDECDMIFDPLKSELNFPIGDRVSVELESWRWQFAMALMSGLYAASSDKDYQPRFISQEQTSWVEDIQRIREVLWAGSQQHCVQMKPNILLLNKHWYMENLAVPIGKWALLWLTNESIMPLGRPYYDSNICNAIVEYVSGLRKNSIVPLLHGNNSERAEIVLQFARKWITVLMPHCLSKRHGIEYGLLQGKHLKSWKSRNMPAALNDSRLMLAVPYQGLETPSPSSEFSSPDVAIGLTCLAYHHEGLRLEDVKVLVAHMRYRMLNVDHGPYSVRPSRSRFETWKEDARSWCAIIDIENLLMKIPSLEHLQTTDDNTDTLKLLHKVIHMQLDAQWEYLDTYVFPRTMRIQKHKLQASGVDIGSPMLFASRIGFSGTPSNLLPLSLRDCEVQPGTRAKVIRTLINPRIVSCEPEPLSGSESSIQLLDCAGRGEFHALVDTGALITGFTNREIAYEILKRLPAERFTAVAYIDDSGTKRALMRGEDLSAPPKFLSDVHIPENQRFTFYDQVHTTGIDIKQAIDAVCLLTIGKGMTLRDLMQGAWRMRGIGKGQTIRYQMTREIVQLINRDLSICGDGDQVGLNPSPIDIVSWLVKTQMQVEDLQHLSLSIACVNNVWRRQALENLLHITRCTTQDTCSHVEPQQGLKVSDNTRFKLHTDVPLDGNVPFFSSPFVSLDTLKTMAEDCVDSKNSEGLQVRDGVEVDSNNMSASIQAISNLLDAPSTSVKIWLSQKVDELRDEKVVCPHCSQTVPDHSESCSTVSRLKKAEKVPKSYQCFKIYDSDGPIRSSIATLMRIKEEYPDAVLLGNWFKDITDFTAPDRFETMWFKDFCASCQSSGEEDDDKIGSYYDMLSYFRDASSRIAVFKDGKCMYPLSEGGLYASAVNAVDDVVTGTKSVGVEETWDIRGHDAAFCKKNVRVISLFKEEVSYPAGQGQSESLSVRLRAAIESYNDLWDERSYVFNIQCDSSGEWTAEKELNFYISALVVIEEKNRSSTSSGGGLDTEQEQEQEQEQEKEQDATAEEDKRIFVKNLYGDSISWEIEDMLSPSRRDSSFFYHLSRLTCYKPVAREPPCLLPNLPQSMLVSCNFGISDFHSHGDDIPHDSRAILRPVRCVVLVEANDFTDVVMVTLEEAQSLRYAMLNQSTFSSTSCLKLVTPSGFCFSGSASTRSNVSSVDGSFAKDLLLTRRGYREDGNHDDHRTSLFSMLQVLRLYNNELFFSPSEIWHLLQTLQSLDNLSEWVDQLLKSRPRLGMDGVKSLEGPIRRVLGVDSDLQSKDLIYRNLLTAATAIQSIREKLLESYQGSQSFFAKYKYFKSKFVEITGNTNFESDLRSEFAEKLIATVGADVPDIEGVVNSVVEMTDTDGNGIISLDEFMSAILEPTREEEAIYCREIILTEMKNERMPSSDTTTNKENREMWLLQARQKEASDGANEIAICSSTDSFSETDCELLPAHHVMSSFGNVAQPIIASGENLIVHTGIARCPASNFNRTTIIPNGVVLVPFNGSDKFYFEVAIVKSKGSLSVGWVDGMWNRAKDEQHICTISGHPALPGSDNVGSHIFSTSSVVYSVGDVIGCLADMTGRHARFYFNGVAVESLSGLKPLDWAFYISPVVIFEAGLEFDLNLGQCGFKFAPGLPGVRPVFATVVEFLRGIVSESTKHIGYQESSFLCFGPRVVAEEKEDKIELRQKNYTWKSNNVLLSECALFTGKWYLEIVFDGYRYWGEYDSGIGCVGPDYFPALDMSKNPATHPQGYILSPLTRSICHSDKRAIFTEERQSWGKKRVRIHMRVDMDERRIDYFQRKKDGSLQYLTSFDSILLPMLRPIISIFGSHRVFVPKNVPDFVDGYENMVRQQNLIPQTKLRVVDDMKVKQNMIPTSGAPFVGIRNDGVITSHDGYISLVATFDGITWPCGVIYYEIEVIELGGEGRGRLNPTRNPNEGGQMTIGWATKKFRGESYSYRGVGDDRLSWGLRAADSRPWGRWANVSGDKTGPCFVHSGKPVPWESNGVPVPQHPPSSGRSIASGDIIGCSFDTDTGVCEYFLFRQKRILSKFEDESKRKRLLRFEDFKKNCGIDDTYEVIVPALDSSDTDAEKCYVKPFSIGRLIRCKLGGVLPAISLHPNCCVSVNLGERPFQIEKCELALQSQSTGEFVPLRNGTHLYSAIYASKFDAPDDIDMKGSSVAPARLQHGFSCTFKTADNTDVTDFWLHPSNVNIRNELKHRFIFSPPLPISYKLSLPDTTTIIGESAYWFPTPDSFSNRDKGSCCLELRGISLSSINADDMNCALKCYIGNPNMESNSVLEYSALRLHNAVGVDHISAAVKKIGSTLLEISICDVQAIKHSLLDLMQILTDCNICPELQLLHIENVHIVDEVGAGIGKFVSGSLPPHLFYLSMRSCNLNIDAIRMLTDILSYSQLRHLILSGNPGVHSAIAELADAISGSTSLTHLDLSDCGIRAAGALCLCESVMDCDQMAILNISGCQLGPTGIVPLARSVMSVHRSLTTLDISRNGIGQRGAKHIAHALQGNEVLLRLNISGNDLGPAGGHEIATGISNNFGLRELVIDDNDLNDKSAVEIGLAIVKQQSIRMLSCRDDSLSTAGEVALALGLRSVAIEFLFIGKADPLLHITSYASFQSFLAAPLSYAVRHCWVKLASYLASTRNEAASEVIMSDDEDDEDNGSISQGISIRVDDDDAVDALHILLSASDDLYPPKSRLALVECMIGHDGCSGLRTRSLRNVMWYTPDRSNSISSSHAEYLEDFWCCGCYRSPPRLTQSLDTPVHGWCRIESPDYTDFIGESNYEFNSYHELSWKAITERSYRYEEHGFWSVYWCPRMKRSFCVDKRSESKERYFWLPHAHEVPPIVDHTCDDSTAIAVIEDEIRKIRKFAIQGLLYLEQEAVEWLAEMLRKRVSYVHSVGILKVMEQNKDKLMKRCSNLDAYDKSRMDALSVKIPTVFPNRPSACELGEAVCYLLFLVRYEYKSCKKSITYGGLPWLSRSTLFADEYRTVLQTALVSRQFNAAKLLLNRRAKCPLTLSETDSRNICTRKFPYLEAHEAPEQLHLDSNLRWAYLRSQDGIIRLWENPDLLHVQGRLKIGSRVGESSLYMAVSSGQSDIVERILARGASFDIGESLESLCSLLYTMCSVSSGSQVDVTKHALFVLSLVEKEWNKDKRALPLDIHPLYAAVEYGREFLVRSFLENAERMNSDFIANAVGHGNSIVSDIQWRTSAGWTLLSRAVYHGHYGIVLALLDAHADPLLCLPPEEYDTTHRPKSARICPAEVYQPEDTNGKNNFSSKWPNKNVSKVHPEQCSYASVPRPSEHMIGNSEAKGCRPIPNAHVMALLRVHRQQRLVNSLEDRESSYDVDELPLAHKKLKVCHDVLQSLNENESVAYDRCVWITKYAIKKSIFYAVFVIFFTISALFCSHISSSKFRFNELAAEKTMGNEFPLDEDAHAVKTFNDIGNEGDMWSFLGSTMIDNLYPDGFSDGWLDHHNRLIGGIRLLQSREESSCTGNVNDAWNDLAPDEGDADTERCYRLRSSSSSELSYEVVLPGDNSSAATAIIASLESEGWVDGATKAVRIEYVVGNVREDLLQLALLRIDFPGAGDTVPSSDFIVLPVSSVSKAGVADILVACVGAIFLLFLVEESYEMVEVSAKRYFMDRWNIFDLVVYILGIIWCCLICAARLSGRAELNEFTDSDKDESERFIDLWGVGLSYMWAEFVVSLALMGAFLKFIKYLQFLPLIGPDMLSLLSTLLSLRVLTFTIFLAFFIVALGIGVFVRFGGHAVEFASFGLSIFAIFSSLLGESYFEAMVGGNAEQFLVSDNGSGAKVTAVIFFVTVSFVGTLILANIFINVTGSVYDDAHESSLRNWTSSVDDLMIDHAWEVMRLNQREGMMDKVVRCIRACFGCISEREVKPTYIRPPENDWSSGSEACQLQKKLHICELKLKELLEFRLSMRAENDESPVTALLKSMNQVISKDTAQLKLKNFYWMLHEWKRERAKECELYKKEISEIKLRLHCLGVDIAHNARWWAAECEHTSSPLLLCDIATDEVTSWEQHPQRKRDGV